MHLYILFIKLMVVFSYNARSKARSMGSGVKAHFDSVFGAASVLDDEDESSEFGAGSMNLGLNPHLSARPEEFLCD